MDPNEYIRKQAARLLKLADECRELEVKAQLLEMAKEYLAMLDSRGSPQSEASSIAAQRFQQRSKPKIMPTVQECSEVQAALTKAAEYADLAAQACTASKRDEFLRMERKWLRIADGWRMIAGVGKAE